MPTFKDPETGKTLELSSEEFAKALFRLRQQTCRNKNRNRQRKT